MFEVKCGENTFVLENWTEVEKMWSEIVMAVGAEDAEMTVRFAPETE
jgi:hypothetical protein